MWKAIETKAREIRVAKMERERGKRESRKEAREEEKRENDGCEKSSRRMRDLG